MVDALMGELEVDAHVQAAVAEVAVDDPVAVVAGHEVLEVAQVVPEVLRRHGGVLPARPRLGPGGSAGGEPGALLPDPPEGLLVGGVGDHGGVAGAAGVGQGVDHGPCGGGRPVHPPRW